MGLMLNEPLRTGAVFAGGIQCSALTLKTVTPVSYFSANSHVVLWVFVPSVSSHLNCVFITFPMYRIPGVQEKMRELDYGWWVIQPSIRALQTKGKKNCLFPEPFQIRSLFSDSVYLI